MGKVYRFKDYPRPAGRPAHATFFTRAELNLLLSLYSRHVMSGEWRDYAIDRQADMAVFSVFRRTFEGPLFTIAKRTGGAGRRGEYLVFSGRQKVAQCGHLDEALTFFDHKLKIVL
jgi:hypothetical protein